MSQINISTAHKAKKTRHYLPSVTLTTSDVGSVMPINFMPVNKGDKVITTFNQVSITQPTAVKTFGAFHLKTFAFFVPAKTIWRHFEDFMVNSADSSIDIQTLDLPLWELYATLFDLAFDTDDNIPVLGTNSGNSDYARITDITSFTDVQRETYDVIIRLTPANTFYGWKFTARGRMLYKVLVGLGYEVPLRIDWGSSFVAATDYWYHKTYDALPLLAMGRVFFDYIYPSAYVQQQGFQYLFEDSGLNFGTIAHLRKLLDLFFVPMEQDFFNSLWLKPNAVATGNSISNLTADVAFAGNESGHNSLKLVSGENQTGVRQIDASNVNTLTSNALRWLESVSDFVIRNNIGGTRFHEWAKAHFGWVSNDEDSNRSVFLKSWRDILSFDGVTASSETENLLLGDRAANGNSRGGGTLKFDCKEFGFLIYIHMVVPVTDYYQGEKPWVRVKSSREEYFIPELDGVGMQPVPRSQIYSCYERWSDIAKVPPSTLNNAFGFSTRYANEYKRGCSFLNGDFRLPSRNKDKDAYHTFRDVLWNRTNLALDADFLHADNQYDRVFAVHATDDEEQSAHDKIESFFSFDTTKYSNDLSIGDSFPIFNKSGEDVSLDYQGTQLR